MPKIKSKQPDVRVRFNNPPIDLTFVKGDEEFEITNDQAEILSKNPTFEITGYKKTKPKEEKPKTEEKGKSFEKLGDVKEDI